MMWLYAIILIIVVLVLLFLIYNKFISEISVLREKLSNVEQSQSAIQSLTESVTQLREQSSRTKEAIDNLQRLNQEAQSETSKIKEVLATIGEFLQHHHRQDEKIFEAVRRLETRYATEKGEVGEEKVREVLKDLPSEWIKTDYPIRGGRVEFALSLPGDDKVIPIDSKFVATKEIEKIESENENPMVKREAVRKIISAVRLQVEKITKYLDPDMTAGFGIAVIPDTVYKICVFTKEGLKLREEASKSGVIILSYSLLLPFILLLLQVFTRIKQPPLSIQKLSSSLKEMEKSLTKLLNEANKRFTSAITMLQNSRDLMVGEITKMQAIISSVKSGRQLKAEKETTLPLWK